MSELVPQAGLRGKGPSDRWAQFGASSFRIVDQSFITPQAFLLPSRTWASIGQLSCLIPDIESALLSFSEQFGSVLGSQFHCFPEERCLLRSIDPGRGSDTRRNHCSQLFEELLLACRRADAKHPHRLRRDVMELVRSVRWNVDRFSSPHNTLLPSESSLQFTVEKNKGLLEIMTMWGRAAPGGTCISIMVNRPAVSIPDSRKCRCRPRLRDAGHCCYPGLQPPDSVVDRRPESLPCLIS